MRFRIGSIGVSIRPAFFLIAFLLGYARMQQPFLLVTWMAIVLLAVLVHELGHAVAFARFGHQPSIELYAMGGLTRGSPGVNNSTTERVLICLAGPLAGFLLGGLVFGAAQLLGDPGHPYAKQIILDLLWVNIGWGVVNLLPIWPLDGGQAVAAVLGAIYPASAKKIGLTMSVTFAAVGGVAGLLVGMPWAAMLAVIFGVHSFNQLRRIMARGSDASLDPKLSAAFAALKADDIEKARSAAEDILGEAKNALVRSDAVHLLAWAELRAEEPERALAALERLPPKQKPDKSLLGAILVRIEGREAEAVEPLTDAFFEQPTEAAGLDLIAALVHQEELDRAREVIDGPRSHALGEASYAEVEAALFYAGRFEEALEVSEKRHKRHRSADSAYNAACSAARLGRTEDAFGWLERAVDAGYSSVDELEEDTDLASLKGTAAWAPLIARMRSA